MVYIIEKPASSLWGSQSFEGILVEGLNVKSESLVVKSLRNCEQPKLRLEVHCDITLSGYFEYLRIYFLSHLVKSQLILSTIVSLRWKLDVIPDNDFEIEIISLRRVPHHIKGHY